MKKNQILSVFFLINIFVFSISPVFALAERESSPSALRQEVQNKLEEEKLRIQEELRLKKETASELLADYQKAREEERLEKLKKYGIEEIEKRLENLADAEERLQDVSGSISDSDLFIIRGNLEASSLGLIDLKTQIETEENLETLKSLSENIFYDYRVYAVELPKNRGLTVTGRISYIVEEKTPALTSRIEEAIERYQQEGKDTYPLEQQLAIYKAQLAKIKAYIMAAQTGFQSMEPARDLTEAQSNLEIAKNYLQQAKTTMIEMKETVKEIIIILDTLETES